MDLAAGDAPWRGTPLGSRGALLVPSALSARLDPAGPPRTDVQRAFRRARSTVIAGDRLDMTALAAALGVDRTSLFRWVGNRDALLAEVLWSLAEAALDRIDGDVRRTGRDRVVGVLTRFTTALIEAPYFRLFLQREPARALRLLTTAASPVQARFVAVTETLVREEADAHRLETVLPAHDLAYLLVRVAESFSYADLIAGEQPDAERAAAALAFLMRP